MNGNRQAIIVAGFGTTHTQTRRATIEACEADIAAAFPSAEVRRAFTSDRVISCLRKRDGLDVENVDQALDRLAREEYTHLAIQPLLLIAGREYHNKILAAAERFRGRFLEIRIGRPLLDGPADFKIVAAIVADILEGSGENEAVVLMGHGTHHPMNAVYETLEAQICATGLGVFIACVEGPKTLDAVIPRLRRGGIAKVTLAPLMLVAGDHVENDMDGDEDSWRYQLERAGFLVAVSQRGLGEYPAFRALSIAHLRQVLEE